MKSLFTILAVCAITLATAQKTEPKKACCKSKKECSTADKKSCKDHKSCDMTGKASTEKKKEKSAPKEIKKAA